jgi:hypothetical protein
MAFTMVTVTFEQDQHEVGAKRAYWRDDEITLPMDQPRPADLGALARVT